jgi:plasmid stabilization system protein ParE
MTEHYQVIYSPMAKDDLKSIYSYIAVDLKEKGTAPSLPPQSQKAKSKANPSPQRQNENP